MKIRFIIYPLITLINVFGAWLIFLYKSAPSVEAIAELGEFPGLAISMLVFPGAHGNSQIQALVTVVGSTVVYLSVIEAVLRILQNRKLKRADER